MATLTIGEVAERTGFSASSLRYYEGIGLVVPAGRTDAGHRLYDEATLDRLAFVARAKQLGCTLEEIADLVSISAGDRCGPVQRRFHDLVTAKVAETQRRRHDLAQLAAQLRAAADRLGEEPVDGPCGPGCACLATEPAPTADLPIACTLPAAAVGERQREWQDVLAHVTARGPGPDGARRLAFGATVPVDALLRLVAAEQRCCAFLAFTVHLDGSGIAVDVRAPDGAEAVVDALFGAVA